MSPIQFALILVVASIAAWVPFVAVSFVRTRLRGQTSELAVYAVGSGSGTATPTRPDVPEPLPKMKTHDVSDVSRRQFLNRGMAITGLVALGQFALASLDFLYPRLRGGLGSRITVGSADDIRNEVTSTREPKFIPDGRFFVAVYEGDPEDANRIPAYRSANVAATGFMALYRKCVHLGCSVPWCAPAKWFECPCHGSKYSINGEYRDGPAPRSLDQFKVEVVNGELIVDTSSIIQGAPRGTVTSQPQPEGGHCVNIRAG
ncbi:MAG: Rieske 2Fe-2S domain-containing protein [Actinomycetota bacterium]|nr:Rieske 2Fe-2S domain-containing protein [Actinomycetota bacterium]